MAVEPPPADSSTQAPASARPRTTAIRQSRARLAEAWQVGIPLHVEDLAEDLKEAGATADDWGELIVAEVQARRRHGEAPTAQEYLDRFPSHAERVRSCFTDDATCRIAPSGLAPAASAARAPAAVAIPGYDILDVLGRGGMGVVYRARHRKLNRMVALKMVLAGRHADSEDLQRFWREAEAVAALSHPNIVQVYEVGEHEGVPYLALEFIEGGTLADRLHRSPIEPAAAAELVESLARAAHAAHEHGIIHRDLKPANVLLQQTAPSPTAATAIIGGARPTALAPTATVADSVGVPKIVDFGIAKRLGDPSRLTVTGMAAGTPQYMAPEQASGDIHKVGPAADVYALGVILYECLTGRTPFDGATPVDIMKRVVSDMPPAPSRFRPRLPRDLETIALKCLDKEPGRRYASAAHLADDLRRYLDDKPIVARPVSVPTQAWRWCRRNPVVAGLLFGIMVTLAAGTGVAAALAVRADGFADQALENAAIAEAAAEAAQGHATDAQAKELEARAQEMEAKSARDIAERLRREADAREKARARELYDAHMTLAQSAWEAGQARHTRSLLKKYRPAEPGQPDVRGFEWFYLQSLTQGNEAAVNSVHPLVAVAPVPGEPRWAVVMSQEVSIWDPATVTTYTELTRENGDIRRIAFSRDGRLMAVGLASPRVIVYDRSTRRINATVQLVDDKDMQPMGMAFSPDGKVLYAAVGSTQRQQSSRVGALVAVDTQSGGILRRFSGIDRIMSALAISRDGKTLAVGGYGHRVKLFDPTDGSLKKEIPTGDIVCALAMNPAGDRLAVGLTEGIVSIFSPSTGQLERQMRGHRDWVTCLSFADDGVKLASAALDGIVRVWDARTGAELRACRGHDDRITCVAFGTTGNLLFTAGSDGKALLWDVVAEREGVKRTLAQNLAERVMAHPKGKMFITLHHWCGWQVYDLETTKLSGELVLPNIASRMTAAALSTDGQTLAIAAEGVGLYLAPIDLAAPPRHVTSAGPNVDAVAYSGDGRWLAVAARDGRVMIYPADGLGSPRVLAKMRAGLNSLAFDPTNAERLGATCRDGTIRVWDRSTGAEELTVQAEAHGAGELAFAPDGQTLATAGRRDRVARLWDARTGRLLRAFEGHTRPIDSVAFDPSGTRLATGSADLTAKVWDVATGIPTLSAAGHNRPVRSVAFSRDGSALAAVSGGSIRVLNAGRALEWDRGRLLAAGTQLKDAMALWTPDNKVTIKFQVANVSAMPLGPAVRDGGIWGFVEVERLGDDPRIPGLREPNDIDQIRVGQGQRPIDRVLAPGEKFAIEFRITTAKWPPGKYRLHLSHGWPGEPVVPNGRTTCDVEIPRQN